MSFDLKRTTAMAGLQVRKYSPEICTSVGILGFVGTVVLACRQTFKANDILEIHHGKIRELEEEAARDGEEIVVDGKKTVFEYPEELQRHDIRAVRLGTAIELTKTYAPVIALGTVSIAAIMTGFRIMSKRYLAVVTAYNGLSAAFTAYRARVIEEQGKIYDRHYMYGTELKKETITVTDPETGKKHKEEVVTEVSAALIVSVSITFS